jgi:hypothetical protein
MDLCPTPPAGVIPQPQAGDAHLASIDFITPL